MYHQELIYYGLFINQCFIQLKFISNIEINNITHIKYDKIIRNIKRWRKELLLRKV